MLRFLLCLCASWFYISSTRVVVVVVWFMAPFFVLFFYSSAMHTHTQFYPAFREIFSCTFLISSYTRRWMQGVFNSLERGLCYAYVLYETHKSDDQSLVWMWCWSSSSKELQSNRDKKKKSQTNKTNNKASPARLLINPTRSTQNVHVYTASLYDTHIFPCSPYYVIFSRFLFGFVCFNYTNHSFFIFSLALSRPYR